MAPLLLCVWLHAPVEARQTIGISTGSITGRVTDTTGAALADVTVVISSDALIGTKATKTNAEGRYDFALVPPGTYKLVFARAGFESAEHHGARVGLGTTASVNIVMKVAGKSEEVRITAPLIDPRSPALGTTFDAAALADLPGVRSVGALLRATPSVFHTSFELGGGVFPGPYGAYGTSGLNRPMIEGISVTGINPLGLTIDYGAFDHAAVGAGAHGVEWMAAGVQMQLTGRSGGDQHHASLYLDFAPQAWQSTNIDDDQIARGAAGSPAVPAREGNQVAKYHDLSADLGGFIRRERLWYYGSVRQQTVATRHVNYPVAPLETRLVNLGGKLTGLIGDQHRLIGFGQASRNDQPTRLDPFGQRSVTITTASHATPGSTDRSHSFGGVWKVEWNAGVKDRLFLEARGGQFAGYRRERPNGAGPRSEDVFTFAIEGGGRDWQTRLQRDQLYLAASYSPDWMGGSHFFKFGGEATRQLGEETWYSSYWGDLLHVFNNGQADDVYLMETPSWSINGLWWYAAYLTDTWRLRRATLSLGGRFDWLRVFLPEQWHPAGRFNREPAVFPAVSNVMSRNAFAPRLGVVLDLDGDGRTLLKANASQYWSPSLSDLAANSNPNTPVWWRQHDWTDSNNSRVWESGEQGGLIAARGGEVESIDPALALPYTLEAALSLERELARRLVVRAGAVWRGERQPFQRVNLNRPPEAFSVPGMVADPGPDGTPGTTDDGSPVQVWQLAAAYRNLAAANILRNMTGRASEFTTLEAGATARGGTRWSLNVGLAYMWHRDHAAAYLGQNVRQNAFAYTPNDFVHTDQYGRHAFNMWSLKAHGTYVAPWDVRVLPLLHYQSGQPFGRTISVPLNPGSIRMLVEPIGARRMDDVTLLDLRVEKGFRFQHGTRVAGFVEVFNLLNANPAQQLNWASGLMFNRPISIVSPRNVRLGVKLGW
jgi:hypothetical protein